jgi:hypothetical protein
MRKSKYRHFLLSIDCRLEIDKRHSGGVPGSAAVVGAKQFNNLPFIRFRSPVSTADYLNETEQDDDETTSMCTACRSPNQISRLCPAPLARLA